MIADYCAAPHVLLGVMRYSALRLAERCKVVKFNLGAFHREGLRFHQNSISKANDLRYGGSPTRACSFKSSMGTCPLSTAKAPIPYTFDAQSPLRRSPVRTML